MRKSLRYLTPLIALLILLLFKPVTVFILESYLSSLLETDVEVVEFHLLNLDLQATIKEKTNIANVKINSLYPLQADVSYQGNADAFQVYHPLKAKASLQGQVYYQDTLKVDAELIALGAKAIVGVNEDVQGWDVTVTASGLDLAHLKNENNLSIEMSGIVDGELDFHTHKDSTVRVSSDTFSIKNQSFRDFELQVSRAENELYAWTIFDAKDIDYRGAWFHYDQNSSRFDGKVDLVYKKNKMPFVVNLEGEHDSSVFLAQASFDTGNSRIDVKDIVYDINSSDVSATVDINIRAIEKHRYFLEAIGMGMQGDFLAESKLEYKDKALRANVDMQSLGGNLQLDYKDAHLQWQVKELELAKLLYLLSREEKIKAKIDTSGSFYKNELKARLNTKSLNMGKDEIKNINLTVKGPLKNLGATLHLETPYANIEKANINIRDLDTLKLDANVTTPYTTDDISVEVAASHLKDVSSFELNATSNEFVFFIPQADFKESKLDGKYQAMIEPKLSSLKERLHLNGEFSYDKVFKAEVISKDLDGELRASLKDKNIKVKASKVRLEKLLDNINQPAYARGEFDLNAQGDLDEIDFTLRAKHLTLDQKETGLDENLSCVITGKLSSEELLVWPNIQNRYLDTSNGDIKFQFTDKKLNMNLPLRVKKEKEKLDLLLSSNISLQKDIQAELLIKHKKNQLSLNKLIYKDQKLQTNITLNIKDLHVYKAVSGKELYGPLKMTGKAGYEENKPSFLLNTDSLGGKLNITLKENKLHIGLDRLSTMQIGRLLNGEEEQGNKGLFDGHVNYNFEKRLGLTKLDVRNMTIQGVDIDSELKGLQDAIGLNVFAMGNKLYRTSLKKNDLKVSTYIEHMKLDLNITPDLIVSEDIALATPEYRFAVNTNLKHDGEIKAFEVAVLDRQGCAVLTQKLKGNISSPELVDSKGTAVVLLGSAPEQILKTGGKILDLGSNIIDSSADFIWKKALRQDTNVTLVNDTMTQGFNVLSSGKDMVVSGECKVFYEGAVKHPQ